MWYIAPSLRLFVLNSLQVYHHFIFSKGSDCDICDLLAFLPCGSVLMGDYSPTAPSLRPHILNGSLIRCGPVQVYHHQPRSRVRFLSVQPKVLRVVNASTSLALELLVVPSFISEGAEPSTMSSHPLPITQWKSRLLASWPPVWKSAWQSCWMPSCFLNVVALLGLSPLCRCCIYHTENNAFQLVHWCMLGICCLAIGVVYRVIT
jgi:hypothetical protein